MTELKLHQPQQRFSWLYNSAAPRAGACDRILLEIDGAKVVPSLGSIVPGWTLTFPATPKLNLSLCSVQERRAVVRAADHAALKCGDFARRVFHFEHGAGRHGSVMGCGLDIAHLHTVPVNFDLFAEVVKQDLAEVNWTKAPLDENTWDNLPDEYLIIWENGRETALIGDPKIPTSQFFRRAIANISSCPFEWDYKAYSFQNNIDLTVRSFLDHE